VIEDNEADVMMLEMILTQTGVPFAIQSIKDGEEACRFAEKPADTLPDLIVLDLNLHKIDGVSVLKRLRKNEQLKSVPVVVWSSTRAPRDHEAVAALGVTEFLVKPSTLEGWTTLGMKIVAVLSLRSETHPIL